MKKSAQDREIEKLKKQVEKLKKEKESWRKRSIPTHSGWLYPLTFDAEKGLKEA